MDLVRLKFCLTPLHRVLDQAEHCKNRTQIHLDVVGGHTECHCVHIAWLRYQATECEAEKLF